MFDYFIQMDFVLLLCVLIQVNLSQANATVEETSSEVIFGKNLYGFSTSCAQIPRWKGVDCTYLLGYGVATLTFKSFKYLPPRLFQGFYIFSVILLDRDTDVAENVFEGIGSIREFTVEASTIKVIPDFRFANNSIERIQLSSSRLTALDGQHLQNLYNVRHLSITNNFIQYIDPDVFKGTEKINSLNLDNNLLTHIPPKLLDALQYLVTFSARHNNLLHVDQLFHIIRPSSIYLEFNNITSFSFSQLFNFEKIQQRGLKKVFGWDFYVWKLDLSFNHIRETSSSLSAFERNHDAIFTIGDLKLNGNKILNLNDCLRNSRFQRLEMTGNQIQFLTDTDFLSVHFNEEIFLHDNLIRRIDTDTFRPLNSSLQLLNLSFNKIVSVNGSVQYLSNLRTLFLTHNLIQRLEMTRNQIQFLTDTDFLSVHFNEEIFLHDNQIRRIDTDTFRPLNSSLQLLNLSFNKIVSVNGSVQYLSNLRTLFLTHNSIQTFAVDEFMGIQSLRELHLDQNQIKTLGTVLKRVEMLQYLNITQNSIKLMKRDLLPESLKNIELAGNPLICDCNNMPFFEMLKDDEKEGRCLRSEHERKHLKCPDVCICKCTEYGVGSFSMFVDCSSRNLSLLPNFMEHNLSESEVNEMFSLDDRRYRVMYQNVDSSLQLEGNVLGISLENNRLDNLDAAQLPPNLTQLYLSNNNLRRFPQSVIDSRLNLEQVSLSGNPWQCDCDALEFKNWLISHIHIIKDSGNVRCGTDDKQGKDLDGSVIWELDDIDLCPVTDFVLIFSVSSLSFLAVCLFVRVIYAKYELNIKVSLYSHGFTFVKEDVLDQDKAFDAFISYSYIDDEFVIKDIIQEIENRDPNIRLCLHYRHFRPGVPIIDNVTHAVQKSKRTVMILTRNFLQSEWCLLEFKTAHNQTLQDKVQRVVVIKVEELPKKIDPTIKLYLDSTTYLTWGESNFWNKLFYILPPRNSDRGPVLRFVSDNETVFNS